MFMNKSLTMDKQSAARANQKRRNPVRKGPFELESCALGQPVILPKIQNLNNNDSDNESMDGGENKTIENDVEMAVEPAFEPKPIYNRESRLGGKRASAVQGKRISFAEGTKDWLGLRPERQYFDEIVHQFFVLSKQFSSIDVVRLVGLDAELISGVNKLMIDLCKRISANHVGSNEEDGGVPVLLQGGGRGLKVGSFHLPYLLSLQRVVAEASRVVSEGLQQQQQQQQIKHFGQQSMNQVPVS